MTLLDLLRLEWTFFGLKAPRFAWVGGAGLLLFTLLILVRLAFLVLRERRIHDRIRKGLDGIRAEYPIRPGDGLPVGAYDNLARIFEGAPSLSVAWSNFKAQILRQRASTGTDEYWACESAETAFNDATIIDSRLNRSFYVAVPGVVTGLGLLLTFIALLAALLGVTINEETKVVEGLPGLIAGLSGKFLSSVAALLGASIFLPLEKRLLHSLSESRRRLVASIDVLVPRRTTTQILADLHRDSAEQSVAFRSFNTSLAGKLSQSLNESMKPTLDRMVQTIDELNQLMRAAEAQKQESITGSLETLLRNLERSITTSLGEMGERFSASLSGNTRQQFDDVGRSLGGTARLLEGMNTQFQGTQAALNELVSFARSSTAEQMALGRTQVEELTAVLRQLMDQINETAGSSVTRMASTLTAVVHDLSTKVSDLGEQMTKSMMESAGHATGVATAVVEQASNWSSRNAEQLAQLLERHQAHLGRIEDLKGALDATLAEFKDGIQQHAAVTSDLRKITSDVSVTAAHASEATKTMRNVQDAIQNVATLSAAQVEHLAEANRQQEESWRRIQESMRQYQQVFGQVDKTAGELLTQVSQHLRDYTDTSRRGFEGMVKASNELIETAVQRLGASINELEEYLEDLTEVLGKARVRA